MAERQRILVKGKAQRLKDVRRKIGIRQSDFARMLGVATNTITRWERGALVPPRIAELAAEYLLTIHNSKKGEKQ